MYSQQREEQFILQAFDGIESQQRFIDIGCWDPITFSNTRRLFELGWSGVMIEPSPGPFMELLRQCTVCSIGVDERVRESYGNRKLKRCDKCNAIRYGYNSRLRLVLAAVALERELIRIEVTDDALSTNDPDSLRKWETVGGFYGALWIQTITIQDVLNQFGSFEFWNFDVEGHSVDLALELLNLGQRPRCFCVELDHGRDREMNAKASQAGYRLVYSNDTNGVYVK